MFRLLTVRRVLARAIAARQSLSRERAGSVLPLFAICLVPLLFATGMSIDYAKAMQLRTKLNAAADAATLSAVSKQVMDLPAKYGYPPAYGPVLAQQAAKKMFGAAATPLVTRGEIQLDINDPAQFSVDVVDNATHTNRTVVLKFRGQSPNFFASILGTKTLTVNGSATSTVSGAAYTDVYVGLDTSQSMGLAATDDDARKLSEGVVRYNGRGCQFGCHVPTGGEPYANDWVAKQVGATLRVDILRQAVLDMVQTAIDSQGRNSLYRFGLYRIGQSTSDISALTSNLSKTKLDSSDITLGPNDASGVGDTNLPNVTDYIFPRIQANGDGSSQANARAFVFLVTDGVTDTRGGCTYGHCTSPINPATCQRYKDAGVTVGVVYTTYLPVKANPLDPNDPRLRDEYTMLVQPFASQIAPNLQACASNGWYFEASDGPTIHAAMQKLFAQAMQTPILIH